MRRLRNGEAVFDDLLSERLRSFLDVAEGLRPVAFNRLARRRTSTGSGQPWGTATANFVRDLRSDAVQLARVVLRSGADTDRSGGGRGRSVSSGRSRAASSVSSRPSAAAESVLSSTPSSAAATSSVAGSQRSSRRPVALAASSNLASIPDLREVDSTVSSPIYSAGSDISFNTNSRGLPVLIVVVTAKPKSNHFRQYNP